MDDLPQSNGDRRGGWATHPARPSGTDPLLRLVDCGLMGTIFLVPYFMGGRYATGQFVFVSLVAITAIAWSLRTLVIEQCLSKERGQSTEGRLRWPKAWLPALGEHAAINNRSQHWVRTPADWIVPAGVLLILLQTIPLPQSVLATVAPKTTAYLPMWNSGGNVAGGFGSWDRISLVPEATLGGLAIFLAYGLLFFVVVQRVARRADIMRILRWIALSAAVMAGFGLLQYLLSNGKFLWIYAHPFRSTSIHVNGSFINRNHFTHLLVLGLGPVLLGVLGAFHSETGSRRDLGGQRQLRDGRWSETLWRVALGLILFAGLMSLSRGGMIVMALALLVFMAHAHRARRLGRRLLAGGLAVAVVVVVALSIHGYDRVAHRLDDVRSASLDRLDRQRGRRVVWAANLAALTDYPLFGSGVGGHPEVHPMYRDDSPTVEYTHAESGYLQVASETGLCGLALLIAGMACCASWCFRTARRPVDEKGPGTNRHRRNHADDPDFATPQDGRSAQILVTSGAIAAGLAASAVHSLIDFVWYIPACMSITVILAACAVRLWQLSRIESKMAATPAKSETGPTKRLSQPCCLGLTAVTLVAGLWMVTNRLPPALASPAWDSYLRRSLAATERQRVKLREARKGAVALDPVALSDPEAEPFTAATIAELQRVVARYPGHARAHVRLAAAYLEQFDLLQRESPNAMDLSQIRDAAIASKFPSRAELDGWLQRAFGPSARLLDKARWHAHRSLQLCPLQGEAYLFLAELGFLQGANRQFAVACIDQALMVRPHDERVLFAAGKEAALQADLAGAVGYWKACFHVGGSYQLQLIRLLASQVPAAFFLQNFQPRLEDLQLLHQFYRQTLQPNEMKAFCVYYIDIARAEAATKPAPEAAHIWLSASRICRELQQLDRSLRCAKEAEHLAPDDYQVHFVQATLQLESGDLAEAERQLRWCLARKPTNRKLRSLLATTVRRRLAHRETDR